MKNAYFLGTILSLALISCKDDLKPQESFVDYSTKTNTAETQNAVTPALNNVQQVSAATSKVNPPHGQPGHVCGNEAQQQTINTQVQPNSNQQYTS